MPSVQHRPRPARRWLAIPLIASRLAPGCKGSDGNPSRESISAARGDRGKSGAGSVIDQDVKTNQMKTVARK